MSVVLVLDRSIEIAPDPAGNGMAFRPGFSELCSLRTRIAGEMSQSEDVATVVTYSDVAHEGTPDDTEFDYVYGSNLEDGLRLARSACRSHGAERIVLITYSIPSAHLAPDGSGFFFFPPLQASLDAALAEASAVAADGLKLDVFLLTVDHEVEDPVRQERVDFFIDIAHKSHGTLNVLEEAGKLLKVRGERLIGMAADSTRRRADEWFDRLFSGKRVDQQYVGLTVEEATALARQNGVELRRHDREGGDHGPRLIDSSGETRLFMNWDPTRLNFVVEDDRVIRAGFF